MRTKLRIAALLLAVTVVLAWIALGSNTGWTENSVTHMVKDPVTDLDGPVIERKFVPGIDFLAPCLGVALAVFSSSFFFAKPARSAPK
jgi:hypothetical protein